MRGAKETSIVRSRIFQIFHDDQPYHLTKESFSNGLRLRLIILRFSCHAKEFVGAANLLTDFDGKVGRLKRSLENSSYQREGEKQ